MNVKSIDPGAKVDEAAPCQRVFVVVNRSRKRLASFVGLWLQVIYAATGWLNLVYLTERNFANNRERKKDTEPKTVAETFEPHRSSRFSETERRRNAAAQRSPANLD
jgi:cytoskeletal protein RodZ